MYYIPEKGDIVLENTSVHPFVFLKAGGDIVFQPGERKSYSGGEDCWFHLYREEDGFIHMGNIMIAVEVDGCRFQYKGCERSVKCIKSLIYE